MPMPRRRHFPIISALILLPCIVTSTCLAQFLPITDYFRVDPWQYWAATPTYMRMCNQASGHCYSNIVSPTDSHILGYQDNAIYGITSRLPGGGVGVTRDFESTPTPAPKSYELKGASGGLDRSHVHERSSDVYRELLGGRCWGADDMGAFDDAAACAAGKR